MKHSRILRASIIITLLAAVIFFLSVLAWRHFSPAIARAEQGHSAEIAAGRPIGDDVAPERPLSASLNSVDDVPPASLAEAAGQSQPFFSEPGGDAPDAAALSEKDAASVQENDGDALEQPQAAEHAKTSADVGSRSPEPSAAPGFKVQLFGTVEFKRPLSSLPGWMSLSATKKIRSLFLASILKSP